MNAPSKKAAKKAVVLVSGGLDSATVLAKARSQGFACYALSIDYKQRCRSELDAARQVAKVAERHQVLDIDLRQFGGSALTDDAIDVPTGAAAEADQGIPVTYVPARNTVFLSLALAWAEALGASDIFIGVNAVDYSGYPDCRPEFIDAFAAMANLATKAGVEGGKINIHTPLLKMSKAEIIAAGTGLGVDYAVTVSCYQADDAGRACGACASCRIRREGFAAASLPDPTRYQN